MDAHAFAEGLRQIADWYEANPNVALPYDQRLDVYGEVNTSSHLTYLLHQLGNPIKKSPAGALGELFSIERSFNGVGLRFVFSRHMVCTRRVVGTRVIPARSLPAQDLPERVEEIVEWDCESILADESPAS